MSTPLEIAVYQTRDGLHRARVRWTGDDGGMWQGYGPAEMFMTRAAEEAVHAWRGSTVGCTCPLRLTGVTRCR